MHSDAICFDEPMGRSCRITVVLFINHMDALNSKDARNRPFLDELPQKQSDSSEY
jgi:hypothetical protein